MENLVDYREKFIIGASFSSSDISVSTVRQPLLLLLQLIIFQQAPVKKLTALYNSGPLHARPLAQLHTSNALLRFYPAFCCRDGYDSNLFCRHLETGKTTKHSISLATHPLPQVGLPSIDAYCHLQHKHDQVQTRSFEDDSMHIFVILAFGINLPMGLAILVSSFLIFPLRYWLDSLMLI